MVDLTDVSDEIQQGVQSSDLPSSGVAVLLSSISSRLGRSPHSILVQIKPRGTVHLSE